MGQASNLSLSGTKYVGFAGVASALSVPAWKARLSGPHL